MFTKTTNIQTFKVFLLVVLISVLCGWYLSLGLEASGDTLLMPLDDTYIHFQYARQMASGDPYAYNPGQPPTSGATSFLYTPLLAVGYLIGFQGLALGYWAVALGYGFLILSGWLIYKLVAAETGNEWIGLGFALGFAPGGPFIWAALSGMETIGFTFAVLLAAYAYYRNNTRLTLAAIVIVALARPEGAVVALSLGVVMALNRRHQWREAITPLLVAMLVVSIQPIINYLITGSLSATGNQAKSILYETLQPFDERIITVLQQWLRLWRELLTGYSEVDGLYFMPLVSILAVLVVVIGVWNSLRTRTITLPALLGVWLIGISGVVATLDTAFWHFKRYQIPLMALLFVLAGWGVVAILRNRLLIAGFVMLMIGTALYTNLEYSRRYHDNIEVVRNQQLAMARWVDANLPEDAVLAVHDVGVMRYVGHRTTYDVVGLTTEGNAPAWRQGPGTLYENLSAAQPDYFAIYPDIQGLPLLVQADVFGEELQRFVFALPQNTAASATSTQVVTKPDWNMIEAGANNVHQPQSAYPSAVLLTEVDVADLDSETEANYVWHNNEDISGFDTLVRKLPYASCEKEPCTVTDGGRVINGGEEFDLPATRFEQYLVVMRVHANQHTVLYIGCAPDVTQINIIPEIAGHWVEVPVLLSADTGRFCISSTGAYEVHHYWVFGVNFEGVPLSNPGHQFARSDSNGVMLASIEELVETEETIELTISWFVQHELTADGKVFIHLYDDPEQPPIAQINDWFLGALPPANLLPTTITETYSLPIGELEAGTYQLAVGIFDPVTGERYLVDGGDDDRLFLDEITIH
ncbi:MAG: hypothetical protein L0154_15460 [Chloroflexi bacterium]|nr:hypothetical protein [Chloroflexota bacterium]